MPAPLRIQPPDLARIPAPTGPEVVKAYFERLVKMIPAEVVGLYLFGFGLIPVDQVGWKSAWTVFCLVATIFARAALTSDKKAQVPPQWKAVIASVGAFIVWAYSMAAEPFFALNLYKGFAASLFVVAWTFIVPLFYKGD